MCCLRPIDRRDCDRSPDLARTYALQWTFANQADGVPSNGRSRQQHSYGVKAMVDFKGFWC
ncbi:MAG: hypothetical protein ACO4AI_01345 [Prochlorothrix sp.]|nr:hypothetical protein [Prochlorothrix sp.]